VLRARERFGDAAPTGDQASGDGRFGTGTDSLVPTLHMQSGVSAPLALSPAIGD
jgi:hypothetical protein